MKTFKQKILGKTRLGKEVAFPHQIGFLDFTLEDHEDAVRIYGEKIGGRWNETPMLKLMSTKQRLHSDFVSQLNGTDSKRNKEEKERPHDNNDFFKNRFEKQGSKPWDDYLF